MEKLRDRVVRLAPIGGLGDAAHEKLEKRADQLQKRLEKILADRHAQAAFARLLAKGCNRVWLEDYLVARVELEEAATSADSRKADRNLAKAFLASLEKTARLMVDFWEVCGKPFVLHGAGADAITRVRPSAFSGEPFALLAEALADVFTRVRAWAENRRHVLLFRQRQSEQFELLEHIRQSTGRWRFREAADLLSAIYTVDNIFGKHPDVKSLTYLVRRFQINQRRWRKARLKSAKTR